MTTTVKALANLSRRVARNFHRLFSRLFRKAELSFGLTIAIPPFVKMEFHYKKPLKPRPTTTGAPASAARLTGIAGLAGAARCRAGFSPVFPGRERIQVRSVGPDDRLAAATGLGRRPPKGRDLAAPPAFTPRHVLRVRAGADNRRGRGLAALPLLRAARPTWRQCTLPGDA